MTGWILAKELAKREGENLLSREVLTSACGEYPGGMATVIELAPDPGAPEIVFNVRLDDWGEIGVFDYEMVALVPLDSDNDKESGGRREDG